MDAAGVAAAVQPAPEPRWAGVLVRFGEIGIKSAPVRRGMLDRLRQNLLDQLVRRGLEGDVWVQGSRLWMEGPDAGALAAAAAETFGVVSASPALRVAPTLDAILAAAPPLALSRLWSSFAVRARRDGVHPFTSQDVAVQAGSAVHVAATAAGRTPRVDLGRPELELHVDVRQDRAFLFLDSLAGPGGIPVGTQGKVAARLRGRDDALAAWLLLRRGCLVAPAGGDVDSGLAAQLALWGLSAPRDGTLQEAAARWHAIALCSGERLGDTVDPVASSLPVLRPLYGLDHEEAARWMRAAGLEG